MEAGLQVDRENEMDFEFLVVYDNCHDMAVVGSFNGWNMEANKMNLKVPGLWSISLRLGLGVEHEFKFVVDGCHWVNVPHYAVNTEGNHVLQLPVREVIIELEGEEWEKPQIAATFTAWNRSNMFRQRNAWVFKVYLQDGDYHFKFVKNDNWVTSPNYPVDSDDNNLIYVGAQPPLADNPQQTDLPTTDDQENPPLETNEEQRNGKENGDGDENGNESGNGNENENGNGKEDEAHIHLHLIEESGVLKELNEKPIAVLDKNLFNESNEGNANQLSQIDLLQK